MFNLEKCVKDFKEGRVEFLWAIKYLNNSQKIIEKVIEKCKDSEYFEKIH